MIQLPAILGLVLAATLATAPEPPAPADTPSGISTNTAPLPPRLTATLPDGILRAENAGIVNLDYTPHEEKTWYFNAAGNPVDKATAGGYYRKSLGSTADGRLVIQDYYQDNGAPQTAPLILKKDADPHGFDSSAGDSRIVWYRADGSILATQDYKGGADLGRLNYYQNGILAAQTALPFDIAKEEGDPYAILGDISRGERYYYPDGHIMAFANTDDAGIFEILYYRADGSPLMHARSSTDGEENSGDSSTWNANGDHVAREEVQAEIDAVSARMEALDAALRRELP